MPDSSGGGIFTNRGIRPFCQPCGGFCPLMGRQLLPFGSFNFETAWSPPEGIYRAICAAYPDLHLEAKYIEEGMCFAGRYENEGAQLHDYPCSDKEYRTFAFEHFGCEFFDDDEDE
ncbi:DUF1281 family ferredoxin-like fold protein [Neisseria sicca]|uniref:DUF1281 family ferredoxin-like fold protein n=1 Tax=Neisseria sicca TaxID=490 RepID=UPI000D2F7918|nr:hypothetical protein [Neisseria sicca]